MSAPPRPLSTDTKCAAHEALPAVVRCPHCARAACALCWHPQLTRCQTCVVLDPPPALVPWEDRSRGFAPRLVGTFADAFRPVRAAPALVHGGLRPALSFALLTTLPFIAIFAAVEYTHTLSVAPGFVVRVLGRASGPQIARDLGAALLLGAAIEFGQLLLLGAPFITLARAYGIKERWRAALRLFLYRAWLSPVLAVLALLVSLSLPQIAPQAYIAWMVVPRLALFFSMRATARVACGAPALGSWLVVGVALTVHLFGQRLLLRAVEPALPAGTWVELVLRSAGP